MYVHVHIDGLSGVNVYIRVVQALSFAVAIPPLVGVLPFAVS